jgi:PPOX class probable FMN-dependent enzyme
MTTSSEGRVNKIEQLEALYGTVHPLALAKEVDHIHPAYRPFIEGAPFAVLATVGSKGLDVTPRGGTAGFVHIEDEKTLILPDRQGNNRIDSLRNIIGDPRVSLLFLVPGVGETLRVIGTAEISVRPDYLKRFAKDGKAPKSVLVITVSTVFFQCSQALIRSSLWTTVDQAAAKAIPSAIAMIRAVSGQEVEAWAKPDP